MLGSRAQLRQAILQQRRQNNATRTDEHLTLAAGRTESAVSCLVLHPSVLLLHARSGPMLCLTFLSANFAALSTNAFQPALRPAHTSMEAAAMAWVRVWLVELAAACWCLLVLPRRFV